MITLMSYGDRVPENVAGKAAHVATFFADTKAEIAAEDEVVATGNAGDVTCLPGSACITKLGETLLMDSAGAWAEI